jgi:hypothetical protein
MKNGRIALVAFAFLYWLTLSSAAPSKKAQDTDSRKFESPDHTVSFQYSDPVLLCGEHSSRCQGYLPMCSSDQVTQIVCLGYGGDSYAGYNFSGATISVGILSGAGNEKRCFDFGDNKTANEKINGINFKTSHSDDAGMGHYVEDNMYRAFVDRCYAIDLRIATTNFGNYDPGTVKEFKPADREKVFRKLKQVLDTLRLSGASE